MSRVVGVTIKTNKDIEKNLNKNKAHILKLTKCLSSAYESFIKLQEYKNRQLLNIKNISVFLRNVHHSSISVHCVPVTKQQELPTLHASFKPLSPKSICSAQG